MCKRFKIVRRYTIYLLAALLCFCSCGTRAKEAGRAGDTDTAAVELPLPEVPPELTDVVQRADYVMSHFWDSMEAGDTLRCHDIDFLEQNLVNFMSLFPHGSDTGCTQGVASLLEKIAGDTVALRNVSGIMSHYLEDPNSPMCDETHYILFLEELLRRSELPEEVRERLSCKLTMAKKNRPGMIAADFSYIDRDGKRRTLHTTPSGKRLLLIFYDPDCDHCEEILNQVMESGVTEKMTVLAIYTEGNRPLWDRTKASMPKEWRVGIDTDSIVDRDIYSIPAMPVMYLLDSDKRVLLKDASLPQLLQSLTAQNLHI